MQLYENGVAGIHITGSTNFTFDATIGEESLSGDGNVGSTNGQQPIEVIVEGSTLVTFNDLRVQSSNGESVLLVCFASAGSAPIDRSLCTAVPCSRGHTRRLNLGHAVNMGVVSCTRVAPALSGGSKIC